MNMIKCSQSSYCIITHRVQQAVQDNTFIAAGSGVDGFYNINTCDPSRTKIVEKENASQDPPRDFLNSRLDTHFLEEMLDHPQQVGSKNMDSIVGKNDSVVNTPAVHLCVGAVMKKGFQRVVILSPSSEGLMTSSPHTKTVGQQSTISVVTVYEVVIHGGESFLKAKQIQILGEKGGDGHRDRNEDKDVMVTDYSTGWQHSMLLME